jgi:hypothetical protein
MRLTRCNCTTVHGLLLSSAVQTTEYRYPIGPDHHYHDAATVQSPPAFPSSPAGVHQEQGSVFLHGERKGKACLTSD